MVLSREHKHKAYLEAQSILQLGKRWQQLVPGEKRPNFEKAAAEVLRRALGHKTAEHRQNLNIGNRLMHQHGKQEARLLERTLKSGIVHEDVLHSFRDDRRTLNPRPVRARVPPLRDSDPEPELWLQHDSDLGHVSHYNVNSGQFVPHTLDLHAGGSRQLPMPVNGPPEPEGGADVYYK